MNRTTQRLRVLRDYSQELPEATMGGSQQSTLATLPALEPRSPGCADSRLGLLWQGPATFLSLFQPFSIDIMPCLTLPNPEFYGKGCDSPKGRSDSHLSYKELIKLMEQLLGIKGNNEVLSKDFIV